MQTGALRSILTTFPTHCCVGSQASPPFPSEKTVCKETAPSPCASLVPTCLAGTPLQGHNNFARDAVVLQTLPQPVTLLRLKAASMRKP